MAHRFQYTAHGSSVFLFIYLLYMAACAEIEQRSTYRPIHVVVARFREPIDHLAWLSKFPHTIYSRGGGEIPPMSSASPLHIIERLENVGRESFIFLDHIAKHFDHLAEVNVFTQAVQNVGTLYTEEDFQSDVQKLAQSAKIRSTLLSKENDGFVFLVPWCDSSVHPVHMKNLLKEFGEEKCKIFTVGYRTLLNFTVANPRFSGTSCFAVTREAVHRNPKEYYMHLARTMGQEVNPVEGHFFERAWPQVFHSRCSSEETFHCLLNSNYTC